MATLLEVRNLRTYFYTREGVVKAVDGISYDLEQGEILGLVGESGCGKSVSALSILRLIQSPPGKVVDGEVIFDGNNILKMSAKELQQVRGAQISMVFQEPMTSLNPVLSVERQLTESLQLHLGMSRAKLVMSRYADWKRWVFQTPGGGSSSIPTSLVVVCDSG